MSPTPQFQKQPLRIHSAIPFKPSHLSIPPSPFSPRTPLTQPSFLERATSRSYPSPDPTALPPSPLQWLWQCHKCHQTYALGVTRRCLEDGHFFCAGTTTIKSWRKAVNPRKARIKRHRACGSEFDYQGWKSWGRWRRSGRRDSIYDSSSSPSSSSSEDLSTSSGSTSPTVTKPSKSPAKKDCWNTCDYPSECRWGRQFGVHSPVVTNFPTISISPLPPPPPPTTSEGILKPENVTDTTTGKKTEKTDFWSALVASATRRKSVPPSSPLHTHQEQDEEHAQGVEKDGDGDVVMSSVSAPAPEPFVDPQQLSSTGTKGISTSAPVTTFKEVLKKSKHSMSSKTIKTSKADAVDEVAPGAGAIGELEGGFQSLVDLNDDFAPLERVKSRDSGYHSTPDSLM